ncbi:MAG: DUF2911 domain-containing protein, partial [Bacteroidota bacterium]
MKYVLLVLSLLSIYLPAVAQYQIGLIPRQSPDRTVSTRIGYTNVEVAYGSPRVKGRAVWGELVPYDKVWRAGANNATRISFDAPVKIEGKDLPAGTYGLFVLPRYQQKWVIIFSKNPNQWGSFRYKEADDALRVEVLPRAIPFEENLSYALEGQGVQFGLLHLNWERVQLSVEIETDYLDSFVEEVEKRTDSADAQIQWVVPIQGAEHLLHLGQKPELALKWLERSEQLSTQVTEWNPQFYPQDYIEGHRMWIKAQVLAQLKRYKEAVEVAQAMQEWKEKGNFYTREK